MIPIYKGNGKCKSSPDSYRPVSLLPCLLKVFEQVLKTRLLNFVLCLNEFPNQQQQGFQKYLGCLTASFNLHETIFYNLEMFSKVFIAFLDSKKAFDTVWRIGLMYKLNILGIKGKIWSIINDCHVDTKSAVIVNQSQSHYFLVSEGVRQGGVLSGLLYLVFINDLLYDLEKCNTKTGVFQINSCCPSLADDISCISTSPLSLQRMLDVCNQYSCKWRFLFNAKKSSIVQFSVNSREVNLDYSWTIGRDTIPASSTYSHLGILLNSRFKSFDRTASACRKGKNAYFALKGITCKTSHPCALLRLYKSVVLPTVLYGCEMWTNLKSMDIQALNKFQHFIIKQMLDLKTVTRSDMCQSILGVYPILSYIEQRKLYFLQKLCSLSNVYHTKKLFLH